MNEDWNALNNTEVDEMLGNECYTLNCSCINQSMIGALAPQYVESAKTRIRRTRAPLRSENEPNELGFNPAKRGCLIFADGLYSGESHYAGF